MSAASVRRISISFPRIFSFSFISAMLWLLVWIMFTNLFRWLLMRSYSCWKSRSRRFVSRRFFFRSTTMRSFTCTSSSVSRHLAVFSAVWRLTRSRCPLTSAMKRSRACSSRFIATTSFSSSATSAYDCWKSEVFSLPCCSFLR